MDLLLFVGLLGLFAWVFLGVWRRSRAGRSQVGRGQGMQWRDPLDDVDPDSVVYNGYKAVSLRVRIRYTDGYGRSSEREVEVQSYDDTTGIGMFEGFCYLRGARRSFYFARVSRAVCSDTGEVIRDLREHLNALWEEGTGPALRMLRTERSLDLEIMLYVARADKAMRAPEVAIIAQYCRAATGEDRLDLAEIRYLLEHTSSTSLHGFKIKWARLLDARPSDGMRVAQACRDIVATQKTVHPDERVALDYMERKLQATLPRVV